MKITAVGIDVGGDRKGFHAVALSGGTYAAQRAGRDPLEIAHWCSHTLQARAIAIDAPSRWSTDGHMRPCERDLLRQGIRCFASPTREQALHHPTGYFNWMLRGEELYQSLATTHPLCCGLPLKEPACFETFPHAIVWHLGGSGADASRKRRERRALLSRAGIDLTCLTNIDWIDAALCALSAHLAAAGAPMKIHGEPTSGLILVPTAL